MFDWINLVLLNVGWEKINENTYYQKQYYQTQRKPYRIPEI